MDYAPGNGSFSATFDFPRGLVKVKLNQQQQDLIDYLQEENRVLREQGRKYLGSHMFMANC